MMDFRKWLTRFAFVAVGAGLGFAYYRFIGCNSGTCPITSNPWISTTYGAVIGALFVWSRGSQKK
jgi:hypothetical protein